MAMNHFTCFLIVLFILSMVPIALSGSFKDDMLRYPRVREAYEQKEDLVKSFFDKAGVEYPPREIFIRAFKQEYILELWARNNKNEKFKIIRSFDICAKSGHPGPKRKEGDRQVPEGFYTIDRFNPASNYHLSFSINYPNGSDLILSNKKHPGGDIFIHGNCVTIGCIPLQDKYIKELFIIVVESKNNGQAGIPVHIFPCKMTDSKMETLKRNFGKNNTHAFWDNIRAGYIFFEDNKQLPKISIQSNGKYKFN